MIVSLKERSWADVFHSGKFALRNVDLAFTTLEEDIDAAIDNLAIGGREENVTDCVAFVERMVCYLSILIVTRVSKGYKEFSTREGVEIIFNVSLNLLTVPDLTRFWPAVSLRGFGWLLPAVPFHLFVTSIMEDRSDQKGAHTETLPMTISG